MCEQNQTIKSWPLTDARLAIVSKKSFACPQCQSEDMWYVDQYYEGDGIRVMEYDCPACRAHVYFQFGLEAVTTMEYQQ